jgi:hypothetical protein
MMSVMPWRPPSGVSGTMAAFDRYMEAVCVEMGYTKEQVAGTSREKEIVRLRHLMMCIARYEYDMSTVRIGKIFSKDHSSVIYGTKKIQELYHKNEFGFFLTVCLQTSERLFYEHWGHHFQKVAKWP